MIAAFDTTEHPNINGKVMGKQTIDADVIIIGGGPAGATLGCLLANGCHSAIIIERAVHPREHVGELITPSVNAVLHRVGLLPQIDATGFVRREGVGWTLPIEGRPEVSRFPVAKYPAPRALRRYGFNVEREVFDALLLQHAVFCGVRVFNKTIARKVLLKDDRALGVEVQLPDGNPQVLTSRFIVDASGRNCLLGSQLKLIKRDLAQRHCALYSWFRDVEPSDPNFNTDAVVHGLDHHQSWGWQIPLRNGVSSVGIVAACHRFQHVAETRDDFFKQVIVQNPTFRRVMANAERLRPWRVVSDYSYHLQRLYGRGWILIGDASGFIDPIFSSGVDIAMYSAVFAYESILPLLLLGRWSETDEEYALAAYERRVRQGTAVWAQAVGLFYQRCGELQRITQEPQLIPEICRFLQGNPYEVQNRLIFQHLVSQVVHN